jgi:hypothetical protein
MRSDGSYPPWLTGSCHPAARLQDARFTTEELKIQEVAACPEPAPGVVAHVTGEEDGEASQPILRLGGREDLSAGVVRFTGAERAANQCGLQGGLHPAQLQPPCGPLAVPTAQRFLPISHCICMRFHGSYLDLRLAPPANPELSFQAQRIRSLRSR